MLIAGICRQNYFTGKAKQEKTGYASNIINYQIQQVKIYS